MDFTVNFLPVLIASVLFMPLGAFIYSKKVLGTIWMKSINKKDEDINSSSTEMVKLMILTFISSVLTVYLISVLIASLLIVTWSQLLLLLLIIYFIVFLIRFKGTLFESNLTLFAVNMTATILEFMIVFIVFLFFL